MTTVSVSELKAKLSAYLREVRRGGEVVVLDRGEPVARLTGLRTGSSDGLDVHRRRLIRAGIVQPGSGNVVACLDEPPLELGVAVSAHSTTTAAIGCELPSVRYWDASALVPLVVAEDTTAEVRQLLRADGDVVTWVWTIVEIVSAIERRSREGPSPPAPAEPLSDDLPSWPSAGTRSSTSAPCERERSIFWLVTRSGRPMPPSSRRR